MHIKGAAGGLMYVVSRTVLSALSAVCARPLSRDCTARHDGGAHGASTVVMLDDAAVTWYNKVQACWLKCCRCCCLACGLCTHLLHILPGNRGC